MNPQKITFTVNNMHCASCPKVIVMGLEELDGVSRVDASLESKKVTVEYDPAKVSADKLSQVIKDSGYTPAIEPLA